MTLVGGIREGHHNFLSRVECRSRCAGEDEPQFNVLYAR